MLVVDSQVHLFSPGQPGESRRGNSRIIGPTELIGEMDSAGVARAVLVPPRPDDTSTNEYAVNVARQWPDRFGVMGKLLLDRPESPQVVKTWKDSRMFGYRVSFPPGQSWLADRTVDWLWQAAEEMGFPIMVWAPHQIHGIGEVARRYPGARLAIDRLGLAMDDRDEQVGELVRDLTKLSGLENVAVKASGLPCHSSAPYPFTNLHPYVQEVVQAFGARRVFWGTDLTTLPCPYRDAVRMFTEHMAFLEPGELGEIMGLGISRWLNW